MRGIFHRWMCWQRAASRTTSECVRREPREHRRHPFRVDELLRSHDAADRFLRSDRPRSPRRTRAIARRADTRSGDSAGKLRLDLGEGVGDVERRDRHRRAAGRSASPRRCRARTPRASGGSRSTTSACWRPASLSVAMMWPDFGAQHRRRCRERRSRACGTIMSVTVSSPCLPPRIVQQVDRLLAHDVVRGDEPLDRAGDVDDEQQAHAAGDHRPVGLRDRRIQRGSSLPRPGAGRSSPRSPANRAGRLRLR